MDESTRSDLELIRDEILVMVDGVNSIYLFGSVARGTQKKGSDYDILIIVKKFPKNIVEAVTDLRNTIEDRLTRRLEPYFLEIDDLKYASPILYEVYHNNRLLFGDNILSRSADVVKKIKPRYRNGVIVDYRVEH